MEKLESYSSEGETCYDMDTNSDSSDVEEVTLSRKRNFTSSDSDSDIDSECNEDTIEEILRELVLEEERNVDNTEESTIQLGEWNEFRGRQKSFSFQETGGLISQLPQDIHPYDAFALLVDDDIINLLVLETNRYAQQKLKKSGLTPDSRIHKWIPTNSEEIKQFLGLMLWMASVKVSPLANYWSKSKLYNFQLPSAIMSRNRFELLLSNFHFVYDTSIARYDRLAKILPFFDRLQGKFQKAYTPGEDIVIDETLIPWRGRFIFKQYIPNEAHKYGIKLFKLCSSEGYTWSMKIYCGESADGIRETGLPHNVCLQLAEKLFYQGRTLYIDNFYISYELAKLCLNRKTHLVGTYRHKEKFIPKAVLDCKLGRGEMVAKEDDNGIVALKWRDTRDVRILSTKHPPFMAPFAKNIRASSSQQSSAKLKPLAVLEYNKLKFDIDYSNGMGSYATTIRKETKWYQKLGIQLLLGITVVNALVLYKIATKKTVSIKRFRELIAAKLLGLPEDTTKPSVLRSQGRHHITVRKNDFGKKIRRACKRCYVKKRFEMDRSEARLSVKKTATFCPQCPDQPQLCIECFNVLH